MESCVIYPKEALLICRPSLRKACGENRHAAKLLSYLLFRASLRQEGKREAEPLNAVQRSQGRAGDQGSAITMYRTQGQIVREMDGELCARTLRDEAIPCLVELGYLTCEEIKGDKQSTAYTIHPDVIQQGLDHPERVPSFKTMPFYQGMVAARARKKLRAENIPNGAEFFPNGSENIPNGSENIPDRSEFFPRVCGKNSEPEMVSQPASQAASEGHAAPPKNNKIHNKIYNQECKMSASAETHTRLPQSLQKAVFAPPASSLLAQEQYSAPGQARSAHEEAPPPEPAAPSSAPLQPPQHTRAPKGKAAISLTDVTRVPPPEKPAAEESWTPLTCLKLADYYRGETLPQSQRQESAYQKAVQAAISLVNKQGMTYQQVDTVFRYMKGVDEALKDDWWVDKKVDLWHVADHGKAKLQEMERKATHGPRLAAPSSASSPQRPSVLISEEQRQRNLDRLRALVAAQRLQEQGAGAAAC